MKTDPPAFRYRLQSRLFRSDLLVLQIGELKPYNYDPRHDSKPGGYAVQWRDAIVEDLINRETLGPTLQALT